MGVDECTTVFVAHCCLELVDPYGRVDGEGFSLDSFEKYGTGDWGEEGP